LINMTRQERRGKRLFLVLATIIILDELIKVGFALSGGLADVKWLESVARPLAFVVAVALLWNGENWLRWLVGVACVVYGGGLALVSSHLLIKFGGITPPNATGNFMHVIGYPLVIVGFLAVFYLGAGLAFLLSPSLRAFFRYQREGPAEGLFETVNALNAEAGGGEPSVTQKILGKLKLRSGTLVLGDPRSLPGLEVKNISADEVRIAAELWQFPSGAETVTGLTLTFSDGQTIGERRNIGEIAIDSGKLIVADKADIDEHWTDVGNDRAGVISTAPDDAVLKLLRKRFKLNVVRVNRVRAEVVGPVSERLAEEIEEYLKSMPRYADFPFMYFRVQTNNSFDRANYLGKAWGFIPVGNSDAPLMFVCETGHGDGVYDVEGVFSEEDPSVLSVRFIEHDGD
jgi:hypothetical protein